MGFETAKLSEGQKRNAKIIYLVISLALFIWINYVSYYYDPEAAYLPFILIVIFTVPISLLLPLMINIFEPTIPSNVVLIIFLIAGYLQFFYFVPWFTKVFTGARGDNYGKNT